MLVLACQIGGGPNDETPTQIISIPDLLSILATNHLDGEVQGMNQLQAEYQKEYGPGDYIPNVFIQYWSMRTMAYLATLLMAFALWGAWLLYRHRLYTARWFLRIAPWVVIVPFLINTAGWMLTESGRQPWIVQGLHEDRASGVPLCFGDRHLDLPHRLLPDLHRVRHRRHVADDPLRPQTARPRPHRQADRRQAAPVRCRGAPSDEDEPALVY